MVYCPAKLGVAAILVTFTVPVPLKVPAPLIILVADGLKTPVTDIVDTTLKLPVLLTVVPLTVKLLNASVPLALLMEPDVPDIVIVPPVGEKLIAPLVDNVPDTVNPVLYCDWAVGVALIVTLKKLSVPLLSIDDNTLFIVTVPALATKLPVTVSVRATENEFVVVAPLALTTKLPYD